MKKRILTFSAIALAMSLAACSGENEAEKETLMPGVEENGIVQTEKEDDKNEVEKPFATITPENFFPKDGTSQSFIEKEENEKGLTIQYFRPYSKATVISRMDTNDAIIETIYRIDEEEGIIYRLHEASVKKEDPLPSLDEVRSFKEGTVVFQFPLHKGDEVGGLGEVIAVHETLKTPLQTFDNVVITESTIVSESDDDAETVSTRYFAEGYGLIAQTDRLVKGEETVKVNEWVIDEMTISKD